ncbi:MAG TPA: four helix bundle protein [Anaerolineae bacterium]|nr:four helix bundle protein [Anaerolineae bacterium]
MEPQKAIDIQDRTFKFGVRIIKFVDKLPRSLSAVELGRQLLRSGTSIAANMEEANGAESKSDFIHKVSIAYKEARETRLWLGMMKAAELSNAAEVKELYTESDELVRILFASLRKARSSRIAAKH